MKFLKANRRPLTPEDEAVIARLNALADRTRSGLSDNPQAEQQPYELNEPASEQAHGDSSEGSDPLEIRDTLQ